MLILKSQILFAAMTAFFVFMTSSCALTMGYAVLRDVPTGAEGITFEKLKEDFQDYHVHWSGTQKTNVVAYLFDPKNDDRTIKTHEWWIPVSSEKEIKRQWVFEQNDSKHLPAVYRVIGPDNQLYGYLYTSWHYVWRDTSLLKVDEKTLWIDYIPVPDFREEFLRGILRP